MPVAAPQVVLRPMGERDVDAVRALDALVQPTPWSEAFLRDQLADAEARTLLVAEGADGAPVGHAALVVVADEGHVTSIAVDPVHQRRGIGACLLAALCRDARARGLTAMTLEVRTSNEAAISLYRRFGFAPAGVRPGYYTDADGTKTDALVMWIHDVDDPAFLLRIDEPFENDQI
jgi:ribosomal-protein-alanine N-acetyltransferase